MSSPNFKKDLLISGLLIALFAVFLSQSTLASTILNSTIRSQPDLQSGLVGHWTFDGRDLGPNVLDRSGSANHGNAVYGSTGQTSTSTAPGKIGQALNFDGVSDYVGIADNSSLQLATALTTSVWFKVNGTCAGGNGRSLLRKDTQSGTRYLWGLICETNNKVRANYYNGASFNATSKITMNNRGWHHAVGTISGTTMTLYIDGILQETTTITGTQGVPTGEMDIGADPPFTSGSRGEFLNGSLDDVRIYNRALSAAEVTKLYKLGATTHVNATLPTQPDLQSGLVGHWTFDGKDMGPNVLDKSVNANHGNAVYGTTGQTSTSTVAGRIGQALNFDGVNDYVNAGTGLDQNGEVTISAWINTRTIAANRLMIVSNSNSAGSGVDYQLEINRTAGKISLLRSNVAVTVTGNKTLQINKWYHVVAVLSGSTGNWLGKIYVDGEFDNHGADANNPSATNQTTFIGEYGPFGRPFNGFIDDVRIYNYALATSTINKLYKLGATTHINATLPTQPDLQSGLVGHWTFDGKDMGPNVLDKSVNANHGNLILGSTGNTSTTTKPGRIGQTMGFDGVSDYVLIPNSSSLTITTEDISMGGWVYRNNPSISSSQKIFQKKSGTNDIDSGYLMLIFRSVQAQGGHKPAFNFGDGTNAAYFYPTSISYAVPFRKWVHVFIVFNSSTDAGQIYFNGEPVATSNIYASAVGSLTNSTNPEIGRQSTVYFDGMIDDYRVYNRALSAAEVLKLYQLGR